MLLVILSNAGYSVIEAADGIAAIEMAFEQQPDVILLDVSMPAMNGLEVLKRLRENSVTRSIPVIMVTASQGLDTESNKSNRLRNTYFVTKPWRRGAIERAVKHAIRRRNLK